MPVLLGLGVGTVMLAGATVTDEEGRATPKALAETETVPSRGDDADDPAIWVHPDNPELSLVLGTDKKGGLNVFDLDGRRVQIASDGCRPNNVDVMLGFPLGGRAVDLAVAGTRNRARPGVAFWRIDSPSRRLVEVGPIPAFRVFGGGEPYGSFAEGTAGNPVDEPEMADYDPGDGSFTVPAWGAFGQVVYASRPRGHEIVIM